MTEFENIEEVAYEIQDKLHGNSNKKYISSLYAFNGTGKTRLTNEFKILNEFNISGHDDTEENTVKKVLCYDAFFEDLFNWDNEQCILFFEGNPWEKQFIVDEGLENQISKNFQRFLNTKIEPKFELDEGKISFILPTGDDAAQSNIKISRGEESIFIWSIFYTILDLVINEFNSDEDDRSITVMKHLEMIIIDDPISSIDDTKIITLAIEIKKILDSYEKNKLKFLITTHHALFYNVLHNSFNSSGNKYKYFGYILSKNNGLLSLDEQRDSPFGYHLVVKNEIQNAVDLQTIKRYHFNLFRSILEKTANFLGYRKLDDCINGERKEEFIQLLNSYSHNRLDELEYREVPDEHKNLFTEKFNNFITEFNWN